VADFERPPEEFKVRLAVISDIHANLAALEAVLDDLVTKSPDAIINLGDCVSGPLWPRETMELLEARGIPSVRGNHDRWLRERPVEQLAGSDRFALASLGEDWVGKLYDLPTTIDVNDDIYAVHGTPTDDNTYLLEDTDSGRMAPSPRAAVIERFGAAMNRAVVLCGHSHRQSLTQIPGGPLILNPGTVGCPVSPDNRLALSLEFRSPHARYAILTRRAGRTGAGQRGAGQRGAGQRGAGQRSAVQWGVELFALPYDWDRAAARAENVASAAWHDALTVGSVT
jgi:predicted phosphodiesterase